MEIEVSGHHAQSEHDHSGRPDVEAQLSAEKVRDGAEDKCPQNEPDNGEGKQVRDIVSLKKNPSQLVKTQERSSPCHRPSHCLSLPCL